MSTMVQQTFCREIAISCADCVALDSDAQCTANIPCLSSRACAAPRYEMQANQKLATRFDRFIVGWHQISVISTEQSSNTVSDVLSDLGAVSVTFTDASDQPLYEPPPDSHPLWQRTRIIALFEKPVGLDAIRKSVSRATPKAMLRNWKIEIIPDKAWEREWIAHFKPIRFGQRLWICPSHQPPPEPGAINLHLDPGLAFGTGTHPTTALCLEWLAVQDVRDLKIMDYGCGSGILAIASILLGAKQSMAVDIDPQALTATAENAKNNSVVDRISCRLPEQIRDETADIVFANILASPLEELASTLESRVNPGGKLILSGFLLEQVDGVRKAYSEDFVFAPPTTRENWARLDGFKAR